jgi:diacylglycerol kinase family enzyme
VVVAAGGDGTISTVAAQLVGTDRRFGVIPIGTLNHFAKDAGIPLGIPAAVQNLLQGHTAHFDVGEVNGRYFLNNASLGIYPRVVSLREQHRSRWGKWIAFAQAVVTALRTYRLLHARVDINGEQLDRRTPFVFVGNNVYHYQGRHLGRRTDLSSGKLCLLMAPAAHRTRLVWLAVLAILGRLHGVRDFDEYVAPELRIEVRRERLCIALDGELAFVPTPLHFRIRPKALRVIVPERPPQTC